MVFAALSCPVLFGFVFPFVSLILLSLKSSWEGVFGLLGSNAALAALSAFLCLVLGSILAVTQGKRASGSRKSLESGIISFAIFGYAVPGAVMAVGVLLVFGAIEKFRLSPWGTFLLWLPLLSGTLGAMVYSYCVRFSSVPFHSISSALLKISPRLVESARLLGSSSLGALWKIEWPLIRGSVGSAFLFVFVDIVKELPASMLLRPFGFETLAVKTYLLASDERLAEAAPAALMVILIGLLPLLILGKRLLKEGEA
jgi:iron(III) transport system permease protein